MKQSIFYLILDSVVVKVRGCDRKVIAGEFIDLEVSYQFVSILLTTGGTP